MELVELLDERCVFNELKSKDRRDLIETLSNRLYEEGYVKKSFSTNILEREKNFPTGLKTNSYNIAIPHTESEFVSNSCIAIANLSKPILFHRMDNPDESIKVDIVFMFAISKEQSHTEILSKFIKLSQQKEFLDLVKKANSNVDIIEKIKQIS